MLNCIALFKIKRKIKSVKRVKFKKKKGGGFFIGKNEYLMVKNLKEFLEIQDEYRKMGMLTPGIRPLYFDDVTYVYFYPRIALEGKNDVELKRVRQ